MDNSLGIGAYICIYYKTKKYGGMAKIGNGVISNALWERQPVSIDGVG